MQDKQMQNSLDHLLRELDQQTHTTDDIPHIEANQEYDHERRIYDIEIHIYPREEAEPEEPANTVESVPTTGQEPEPRGRKPRAWAKEHARLLVSISVMVCACAILVGCLLYLFPLWTATTTVTLVPVTRTIVTRLTVTIGSINPTHSPIPGRLLPTVTMSQAQTVATTGKAHQDAQSSHGSITFFNAATYVQTIPAGTLVTTASGTQVATDQDVTIGAASYPTFGQASVSAHATVAGPAGNLKAGAIYGPCCRINISAVNGAFSGGQDTRDYQIVTLHDLDTATESLKTDLDRSIMPALQTQVQSTETLVTPLYCQKKTSADRQLGEEAASIHVTLDETCTGIVYQTQALQTLIIQATTSEARNQLGTGYAPSGDIHIATTAQGTTVIQATGTSAWIYQFTQARQKQIRDSIAGKDQVQAKRLLLSLPGVQYVSFSSSATLPDRQHIRLVFITTYPDKEEWLR
ncbi:hypothetical protein KSC_056830 [Ktedonobacter sp. SOSP1-52]|uniref:baseplate J/gp47 family protein n=1 Tax=Ktedonobacter sp. SOSP1-52 TaxID=2778366 RepID=UPI0019169FB9|nr:baseplate J/gp47 family protein [Ktedonobacter sp. SOSP1-52]GHO66791.1 hypothetical protein KSC_056830 [Ktedonobacter sp. SOSP1-52]